MNNFRILTISFFFSFCLISIAQTNIKKLLAGNYTEEKITQILISAEDFHPYPLPGDKEYQNIPDSLKKKYIVEVEPLLGKKWEVLPINLFMEYREKGNGNRTHYEREYFQQRDKLNKLVIAELLENKGRFTNDILNGVWAICDETWWGLPAHYPESLPDVQTASDKVDLFVAETGGLMSWVYYLMQHKFDSISPAINKRITYEIKRRLIDPCLTNNDYHWLTVSMNWNPWICSNWLTALLIVEKDPVLRAKGVMKIMKTLDYFIDGYPNDGGCDEGPGYWDRAGASLFENLDLLYIATNGKIDLSDNMKIKAIGQFICKGYIGNNYFVNFADAPAKTEPNVSILYGFGSYIKDESMKQFASYWAKKLNYSDSPLYVGLGRQLPLFLNYKQLLETASVQPLALDNYLPDLQVMFARTEKNSEKGFYLAAKGGHNAESHNHNDVGNFIVYFNANPLLIDAGVGSYTSNTFNPKERYKIWTMQSGYHNLPTINGVDQKEGRKFAAKDVRYLRTTNKTSLTLDIAAAYPAKAQVKSWNRTISLIRSKQIKITEEYKLNSYIEPTLLNLLTCYDVTISEQKRVILSNKDNRFELKYDIKKFTPSSEVILLDDPKLMGNWGKQLTRIRLQSIGKTLNEKTVYSIVKLN